MIFAPVNAVRIYRNGAVIRRKAQVSLEAGKNEVLLQGISSTADKDSLRLSFQEGLSVQDVEVVPYSTFADKNQIDDVIDEIAEKQTVIRNLEKIEELWFANGNFESRGECSNETIENYLDSLPGHLDDLRSKTKALKGKIEKLKTEKERLEKAQSFRIIKVIIEADKACVSECDIEYSDKNAYWSNTYEIHTNADSDEIKVISRARIVQSTEEDWNNVIVTLYTGNPELSQEIPVLNKIGLKFSVENIYPTALKSAAPPVSMYKTIDLDDTQELLLDDIINPVMGLGSADAAEIDAETMTGFLLSGERTIKSETTGTMVDIKTDIVKAEKRIVCVPKFDNSGYLAAMIKTSEWPLKPSSAKIYLNGNYCGEINVTPDPTKDLFMLSLGKDERISTSRESVSFKSSEVMIRNQKRDSSEFEIRVINNQEKALKVMLLDNVPVSLDKHITVDYSFSDDASFEEKTGMIKWNLTIEGKTTVKKHFSYTVTYPKDKKTQEIISYSGSRNDMKVCHVCGTQFRGIYCPKCGEYIKGGF